jgi:hypothetical protein
MLLNPYPYGSVAFDSPCLVVERRDDASGYFYDAFDHAHFSSWDSELAERVESYDATIEELTRKLPRYAESISQLFEGTNNTGNHAKPPVS